MRRLLVLSALVCCVLAVPAPAQAYHLYAQLVPEGSTTHVYTNCPKGRTLKITVGAKTQSITVPQAAVYHPETKDYDFRTPALNQVAQLRSSATASSTGTRPRMAATCSPASGTPPHTELAFTGVTTGQKLLLAMGLLLIGVVLLMVGYWEPPKRPRQPRPPVKVYAQ